MRKLAAFAALAISTLTLGLPAHAAQVVYNLDTTTGGLPGVDMACFQVIIVIGNADCTYGAARLADASGFWVGPTQNGGFFPVGGAGDSANYFPGNSVPGDAAASRAADKANEATVRFLTGSTVTIDDKGTPCTTDDTIAATWIFGPTAHNVPTGQTTSAVERWTSVTQTMAAKTVTKATATAAGCDYEISSPPTTPAPVPAGLPTFPLPLCSVADPNDCFPSNNAPGGLGDATFWQGGYAGTGVPKTQTTGFERSNTMGGQPAASTTGVIADWSCSASSPASNDCGDVVGATTGPSAILWGTNQSGGATPSGAGKPDFSNVVLKISTDATTDPAHPRITSALAYYTREYKINLGGPPKKANTINSWQGGAFTFTGTGVAFAVKNDTPTVAANSTNNSLNVLGNDSIAPNSTVTVTVPVSGAGAPNHGGTVTVVGSPGLPNAVSLSYSPAALYSGPDPETFQYTASDGVNSGTATVTVTVQPANAPPTATALTLNLPSTKGVDPSTLVNQTLNVATTGVSQFGVFLGAPPSTVSCNVPTAPAKGTTGCTGTNVVYTPSSTFFKGTDTFSYKITDSLAQTSTSTVTVNIADATPVASPLTKTAVQGADTSINLNPGPSGLGNGSLAQHTFSISTQPAHGTVAVDPGTSNATYTADPSYTGADSFGYTITDGDGSAATSTVSVTVTAATGGGAQKLAALDDFATTTVNTPSAPISVLANDTLINGAASDQVVAILTGAADGSCVVVGQQIVYTPNAKFSGDDSCVYQVTDPKNNTATATLHVTVNVALPGGGSSLDGWSLGALLVGVPVAARRRRKR